MSQQHVIELTKLSVLTQNNGLLASETLKIAKPSSFKQANGAGSLAAFADIEAFRAEARALGQRFRKALTD